MIYAGCDIGSLTAKSVILEDGDILGTSIILARAVPAESGEEAMALALADAGLKKENIAFTVSTGYGREQVSFADGDRSEIACHARGAWWCMRSARTIIDIGGQDAKAILVDGEGNVVNYRYNDKCATGTGRFLEVMAEALEMKLEDMGEIALKSTQKINLTSQCVIFAETEVISLINNDAPLPDVVQGLCRSLAGRVAALVKSIGVEEDVIFTGGVAKNAAVYRSLENALKVKFKPLEGKDPQLMGALGAALLAREMAETNETEKRKLNL